jgi:hypothetical protein
MKTPEQLTKELRDVDSLIRKLQQKRQRILKAMAQTVIEEMKERGWV